MKPIVETPWMKVERGANAKPWWFGGRCRRGMCAGRLVSHFTIPAKADEVMLEVYGKEMVHSVRLRLNLDAGYAALGLRGEISGLLIWMRNLIQDHEGDLRAAGRIRKNRYEEKVVTGLWLRLCWR